MKHVLNLPLYQKWACGRIGWCHQLTKHRMGTLLLVTWLSPSSRQLARHSATHLATCHLSLSHELSHLTGGLSALRFRIGLILTPGMANLSRSAGPDLARLVLGRARPDRTRPARLTALLYYILYNHVFWINFHMIYNNLIFYKLDNIYFLIKILMNFKTILKLLWISKFILDSFFIMFSIAFDSFQINPVHKQSGAVLGRSGRGWHGMTWVGSAGRV